MAAEGGVRASELEPLRQHRLLPMQIIPEGYVTWARGTHALAVRKLADAGEPPIGTDTAIVSVADYRRITRLIADQEAS